MWYIYGFEGASDFMTWSAQTLLRVAERGQPRRVTQLGSEFSVSRLDGFKLRERTGQRDGKFVLALYLYRGRGQTDIVTSSQKGRNS